MCDLLRNSEFVSSFLIKAKTKRQFLKLRASISLAGRRNSTTKHAAVVVAWFNGWTLVYSNYFQFLTHLAPNIGLCFFPPWCRKMEAITDFVASGRIWLLKTPFSLTCYKHPVVNFRRSFRHYHINVFLHVVYTYRRQPLQSASCDSGSHSGSWLELQAPSLTQPVRFPLEWTSTQLHRYTWIIASMKTELSGWTQSTATHVAG
jgi:hypothetical protein